VDAGEEKEGLWSEETIQRRRIAVGRRNQSTFEGRVEKTGDSKHQVGNPEFLVMNPVGWGNDYFDWSQRVFKRSSQSEASNELNKEERRWGANIREESDGG
jgi:hypothetical protein